MFSSSIWDGWIWIIKNCGRRSAAWPFRMDVWGAIRSNILLMHRRSLLENMIYNYEECSPCLFSPPFLKLEAWRLDSESVPDWRETHTRAVEWPEIALLRIPIVPSLLQPSVTPEGAPTWWIDVAAPAQTRLPALPRTGASGGKVLRRRLPFLQVSSLLPPPAAADSSIRFAIAPWTKASSIR